MQGVLRGREDSFARHQTAVRLVRVGVTHRLQVFPLVGNEGYKRYLKVEKGNPFMIDEQKLTDEAKFDGVCVLHTNTELSTAEVACQYKKLWMVEN